MAYTKSTARKDFQQNISTIINDINLASKSRNNIPFSIKQCVYRNAIFQTSALLEEYIKSILEDWIYMLHVKNKTLMDIPDELQFWTAGKKQQSTFQNFAYNGNESRFIDQLCSLDNLKELFMGTIKVKDVITQNENISDRKYPSIRNITALFKRFGINDVLNVTSQKGKKEYKMIIKSFSDRRTEIAHHHPTPDLYPRDVVSSIGSIDNFVAILDRVLFSHVVFHSGFECWKKS